MADLVTSRIFTDGEKGITATKLNDIVAGSSIQTSFVSSKPVASTTGAGDNLLLLKSGGTYAQIDSSAFATAMVPLLPDPNPNIWGIRLRSFNALGNPTFEVDQRNVGATVANPTSNVPVIDRWTPRKVGTMVISAGQQVAAANEVLIPGTNFAISRNFFRVTLTTQQTTLAAGDSLRFYSILEGSRFRELQYDVHSASLLVRSSVANLKFSLALQDSPSTKSLVKLCTIPNANTWTMIPLANLPTWPAGNFSSASGVIGYILGISLASGTTDTAPAADTWQSGSFYGAPGMDNFAGKPNGSTFDIAFIMHEPGSQCSTPIDLPFPQNLDECQRYYFKTYDYGVVPGASSNNGNASGSGWGATFAVATTTVLNHTPYIKELAKNPTVRFWSSTGAANVLNWPGGTSGITGVGAGGTKKIYTITIPSSGLGCIPVSYHFDADTGW